MRRAIEENVGAVEVVGAGNGETALVNDVRAEASEAAKVLVDGTAADCAASGLGNAGFVEACEERTHDNEARAHAIHEVVGGFGARDGGCVDGERVGLAVEHDARAEELENLDHGSEIGDVRDVLQANDAVRSEESGSHHWQHGVFGGTNGD